MDESGIRIPCDVSLTSDQAFNEEDAGEMYGEEMPSATIATSETTKEPVKESPETLPIPLVLEPNHPMMERFQAALKTYLLKQIDRFSNQVFELDSEIKKKEKDREQTGLELYSMQQEVYRQQKTLEACEKATADLMIERQSLEESVNAKKDNRKQEIDFLNSIKKKENDLIAEYRKLSSLEKQMEKWEKDMESELTVSQRISEKTQYDKNQMIAEKRQMDMYLLRLMTAVSDFETECRLIEGEIDVKLEEKDALNQTLADATADLQALMSEKKRLLSSWNSVVSTINYRNTVFANLSKELETCQNGFNCLNTEIESYKRSAAEEMKRSEKLAIMYSRILSDFEKADTNVKTLMEKKTNMENNLASVTAMINDTEVKCQIARLDLSKTEGDLKIVRAAMEKLNQKKRSLEDEIVRLLNEAMINDKSAVQLNKLIKEQREKNRKQEISIAEHENKISQKFLEVEEMKEITSRNNEIIKEINNELSTYEDELKAYEAEIYKYQSEVIKKQGLYAILAKKTEKLSDKASCNKNNPNPLYKRIVELEKENVEIQAKNEKLQSLWLMRQNNNMKLTEERNEQLKEISLLRRKITFLSQKVMKINLEYEREKKIETDLAKNISRLQHKMVVLNEIFVGKKDYKENLGKEYSIVQAQYVQNLKDSELEQIRLKSEIKELESNLEELAESMLAKQREMLAWEKKIQSAVEAKTEMQKERCSGGDIGQMRTEIHRMEVRYDHLRKVQEKLILDLEQCVLRRDAIADSATAMEKRQAQGFNTRFMLQKKTDGVKNQIRTVRHEQKQIEKMIQNTEKGHLELKKVILGKEAELMQMEETTKKIDEQLEEGKLKKVSNLETLIRRQKKCKLYESIKSGKYRMLHKGGGTVENELHKVKSVNSDLISVMESLIEDFPAYRFQLKKIYNTFRAGPS